MCKIKHKYIKTLLHTYRTWIGTNYKRSIENKTDMKRKTKTRTVREIMLDNISDTVHMIGCRTRMTCRTTYLDPNTRCQHHHHDCKKY